MSIISPKKIPSLYRLFERAGGDLSVSQAKNYAKDPRHLVLIKGFHLKERATSPPVAASALPPTSLPSPLASSESQMTSTAQTMGTSGVSQNYRSSNVQGYCCFFILQLFMIPGSLYQKQKRNVKYNF